MQDDGTTIQVNEYLRQHFGYKHNHLGVAVGVLFAYIAIFGCALITVASCSDRRVRVDADRWEVQAHPPWWSVPTRPNWLRMMSAGWATHGR